MSSSFAVDGAPWQRIRDGSRGLLRTGLVALFAVLFVGPATAAQVAADREEAALMGAEYLAAVVLDTGSPSGDGAHSAAEAIWALVAAGYSGEAIDVALDHIEAAEIPNSDPNDPDYPPDAGEVGMVVMGLVAAGEDPSDFRGEDYAALLADTYDEDTGEFQADFFFPNVLGALGHLATGANLPGQALDYIDTHACPDDGGFGFGKLCAFGSSTDTTAYVLNLFAAAGRSATHPVVEDAQAYLQSRQNGDGGFGCCEFFPDTTADDTGFALSALAAFGEEDPDAVAALMGLQDPSGGFFRQDGDADVNDWSTMNALVGLAGRTLPVHPVAQHDPDPPQDPAPRAPGGGGGAEVEGSTTVPTNPVPAPTASTRRPVLPDTGPPTSDETDGLEAIALAVLAVAVMGAASAGASPRR